MIVSDLLGRPVRETGRGQVGYVLDVRFEVSGRDLILVGVLVNRRRRGSFLGYERQGASAPWLLNAFFAWLHRGTVLVPWADVETVDDGALVVRSDFRRLDASLESS